jgi:antitoxin (DNA-binding transcriptional repressor) of toxin-antitoxin stability system
MAVTTSTELKSNLGKYLDLVKTEDIYVTRNGKTIAKLVNPCKDRLAVAESLFGCIPASMTLEEAVKERTDSL